MILVAVLVAAGATWDAGVHVEGRQEAQPAGLFILQLDPAFTARTAPGELSGSLAYEPRFVDQSGTLAVLHRGHATQAVQRGTTVLLFDEHASFGDTVFSPLSGSADATPERLPAERTLRTMDLGASLSLRGAPMRRVTTLLSAGFSVLGGATNAARASLPLQHVPTGAISADYALSRLTSASVAASATGSVSSLGDSVTVSLTGALRSRLTAATTADVSAGAAFARTDVAGSVPRSTLPVASAGLSTALPGHLLRATLSLHGALTSAVDRLTLRVYQRAEARGALELALWNNVSLALTGFGGQAYGAASGGLAEGGLALSVPVERGLVLMAGARAVWQSGDLLAPGAASTGWTAFAGATAALPRLGVF